MKHSHEGPGLSPLRALPLIGDSFICDKGPTCDRCRGCGHVCEAHPLRPAHGDALVKDGCPCGAPGMPCRDARRAPIVVTIPVHGWPHRVVCRVKEDA